jgi:hypothetical protein
LATLSTATGNEVFGSVLISPALLTPSNKQNKQTNNYNYKKHLSKLTGAVAR